MQGLISSQAWKRRLAMCMMAIIFSLVDQDVEQNIPADIYSADKGYDDGNNHFYLQHLDLQSAICLKDIHTKKKDANKVEWIERIQTPAYKLGCKER